MGTSYKDLAAWNKAMALVTQIYAATAAFPAHETFALALQLRRAAVSIPSNIAEGQGRPSVNEFAHFLGIARGSLLEVETQLQIARNLNYLDEDSLLHLLAEAAEVGRILNGLIAAIRNRKVARCA